jgi:hypothetical protein
MRMKTAITSLSRAVVSTRMESRGQERHLIISSLLYCHLCHLHMAGADSKSSRHSASVYTRLPWLCNYAS